MTRNRATAIGFSAVVIWALLPLLTIATAPMPPLLLNAVGFAIGGGIGLVWLMRGPGLGVLRGVGWKVYAFGTAGLFGYHFLFFTAFRLAPFAETVLIADLWALFTVLFSGLLPGERLRLLHVAGGLMAFAGVALIALRDGFTLQGGAGLGMALAFGCALTWSGFSVGSRTLGHVPTEAVTVYCLATALLSGLAHLVLEPTQWPAAPGGWLALAALGLGPVGLAFFTWDVGMKRGDIQLLGVASNAAPLLAVISLIVAGYAQPTPLLLVSAVLIAGGAALAARASMGKVRRSAGAKSLP